MIGIHYSKRPALMRGENLADLNSILIKEEWHRVEKLLDYEGFCFDDRVVASMYDSYPISTWEDEDALFVVEGIIYNIPEKKIQKSLSSIAKSLSIDLVSDFVREADGDFIILVYKKDTKQVLIFNDELGGLPFYYSSYNNCFVAGRNCTYIASLCKVFEVSRINVAELLCFNWNMSDRTIFEQIKSLNPAMYIQCREENGCIRVSKGQTIERSYSLINPFKTKKEAIIELKDLFIKGTRTRCDYARTHGYQMVNTMSGGFDSRTVLGGIEACMPSNEYMNVTYEYDRDESSVAAAVLKAVNSNSEYVKLHYNNSPDIYDKDLSFITEGKISTYTNSVCYNDLMYSYKNLFKDKRILYFGGFGGEFIRHPLFESIWNSSNIGSKSCPTLREMAELCIVEYGDMCELLNTTFKCCQTRESFCKLFYDDYYRRYVRGAGEDRIRLFYFSVQPLMSKSFILTIRNRVPLKWVGYEFYTNFLKAIDPALITIERHGGHPNIHSIRSLRNADYRNKSVFTNILKLVKYKYHLNVKKGPMDIDSLLSRLNMNTIKTIIDLDYFQKNFPEYSQHTQCKIAALLFYIDGLNSLIVKQ